MQVTIPEAAKLLKISERTVRRRLQSGELKGSHVSSVGGFAWMVDLPSHLSQARQQPRQKDRQESQHLSTLASGEIATMQALMDRMEAQIVAQQKQIEKQEATYHWQLETKDKQLEAKDKQIEQLHILLQQAQAALPPPRSTQRHWWRFWQRG
jgi:predicted ArsR family transcriptional regulator